jgi:uncharacterized protein
LHTVANGLITVPHTELSAALLRSVIESFVLREGTDYGVHEYSLDEKVARVLRQLQRGEARIVFEPTSQTIDVVLSSTIRQQREASE